MSEQDNEDLFAQRREHCRHSTAIPITVLAPNNDEVAHLHILNDVSAGGLCFVSEHAWEFDTVLTICFHSPSDLQEDLLTLYGQVMWCRQAAQDYYDVGIKFIQPAEIVIDIVSLIESWYAKNLQQPVIPVTPEVHKPNTGLLCLGGHREEEPSMPLLLAYHPSS